MMKTALQFIWSPFLFSTLGFAIAWKMLDITPREQYFTNQTVQLTKLTNSELAYIMLVAMPAAGLVIGLFLAYLSTPSKSSFD